MKKVFLDTNVIIDLVLEREGADAAEAILHKSELGLVYPCVSFLTIANMAYICRKSITCEALYDVIRDLAEIASVLPMNESQLFDALDMPAPDFEDLLQYVCAKANKCDVIVTRNKKDFPFTELPILTPEEFLFSFEN